MRKPHVAVLAPFFLILTTAVYCRAAQPAPRSRSISAVLRDPLPAEELSLSESRPEYVVTGPTFTYRLQKATGLIGSVRVIREGQEVISATGPADLRIDQYRFGSPGHSCKLTLQSQGKDKITFHAEGVLRDPDRRGPEVDYTLRHTFYSDGVVVTAVTLTPQAELQVREAIVSRISARGQFSHYLHKLRDENGDGAVRGPLPAPGQAVRFGTLTSCLQVFSPAAALATFTDGGALYLSPPKLDTAVVEVSEREGPRAHLSLAQYLVHVVPGEKPYVLPAGKPFTFRVGLCVAPCRLPQPRMHDLRMFTWIGDPKYPYPTDAELSRIAQFGYTLFQMHRIGTPGEPRPPAGELERVIRKVHELGMLFLWEENADLLYASAPGVVELQAKAKWALWQGFNYNGRYRASMDPYCDLIATCLASPNGLAEYRLANLNRMFDRFGVDGIYLDDNLAYANCTLWREHGHPREVYDCLIELHEMNWQRRQLLRRRCPHLVLVSHNTHAFVLPVVCDFDILLYGEGYSFGSLNDYWSYYGFARSLPAQGMIWPGGEDPARCPATLAYNYDLLTGGGQYSEIDWRLFADKFPYAKGVAEREPIYAHTYNLAQYYFGLYESKSWSFADVAGILTTTAPKTYAAAYRNQVWGDGLFVVANMDAQPCKTFLALQAPQAMGLSAEENYVLFDLQQSQATQIQGTAFNRAFSEIAIPGQSLKLYCLRPSPTKAPTHLWGGKRLSEVWDPSTRTLTVTLLAPAGLQDTVFLYPAAQGLGEVFVSGKPAAFAFDSARGVAHGAITFTGEPQRIDVRCAKSGVNSLPEGPAPTALPGVLSAQEH